MTFGGVLRNSYSKNFLENSQKKFPQWIVIFCKVAAYYHATVRDVYFVMDIFANF